MNIELLSKYLLVARGHVVHHLADSRHLLGEAPEYRYKPKREAGASFRVILIYRCGVLLCTINCQ